MRTAKRERCVTSSNCLMGSDASFQGTHYFIAVQILSNAGTVNHRYYHDIESYYWVLLWILLRHTEHNLGQGQCEKIFKLDEGTISADTKWSWLSTPPYRAAATLIFKDNKPLTDLMLAFKALVKQQIELIGKGAEPVLTHDAVLEMFEHALDQEGWPTEDYVACYLLDAVQGSASGKEPRTAFPQPNFCANQPRPSPAPPIARNAFSLPPNPSRLPRKCRSDALLAQSILEGIVGLGTSSDSTASSPLTLPGPQEHDRNIGPSRRRKVAVPSTHRASPVMDPSGYSAYI